MAEEQTAVSATEQKEGKGREPGTFQLVSDYKPSGDQPEAIKELVEGVKEGKQCQVLMGHRYGQDLHDFQCDRAGGTADAGVRAQQDTGQSAVCGVQGILSPQPRRIFCLLFRLLSAGGIYPEIGYIH